MAAAVVAVAVAVITHATARAYLTSQRESTGRDRVYLDARFVRDQLRGAGPEPGEVVAGVALEAGASALLRVDGEWFASTVGVDEGELPRDVLAAVGEGEAAWRRDVRRGVPRLVVAVPIPSVDAVYAEVLPLTALDETLSTLRRALAAAVAATTVGGAAIGFAAAGRLVRPLRALARRAEAIAAGDASALDPVADRELEPLVGSLNRVFEDYEHRVEAGSRFASDVSHEVRSPLAALTASIEVLERRRHELSEQGRVALDALREQAHAFTQLVLDLLEISMIEAGRVEVRREPTDPVRLARRAAAVVGHPDLPISAGTSVPDVVPLDRRRIAQAIGSVLENADRYAGGATGIHVDVEDGALLLRIEDRGPGVPEEERTSVFQRFERGVHGRAGPRGTGLGLSLVAEQLALHGGRARVEARSGGGAVFVLEVPLCDG
ncbi:MAG TPA: HAMP domain-containing sensor histidine kinase [Acidimicrobiales bacterium]|nr:HAMP domain-containing sensor histidine kinase [Acidimicrobiales bacterium]